VKSHRFGSGPGWEAESKASYPSENRKRYITQFSYVRFAQPGIGEISTFIYFSGKATRMEELIGRQRRRWRDYIKMDPRETGQCDVEWVDMAQDGSRLKAVAYSSSRRVQPRGVSAHAHAPLCWKQLY
jgi:hypothetical protein